MSGWRIRSSQRAATFSNYGLRIADCGFLALCRTLQSALVLNSRTKHNMLQTSSIQLDFPPPPTLAEALGIIVLWRLIGLSFIVFGTRFIYPDKSGWLNLLAVAAWALGFLSCFLLGFAFTPLNHHHLIAWVQDNRDLNYWIDLGLGLTIWLSAPVVFLAVRKRWRRNFEQNKRDSQ